MPEPAPTPAPPTLATVSPTPEVVAEPEPEPEPLRIVEDLLYTETRLIANPAALADPWKKTKIDQIALMLQAALTARHKVALKLNVEATKLDAIVALLPSLHAPTVSHLYDHQSLAVETVVDARAVRDLIPRVGHARVEDRLQPRGHERAVLGVARERADLPQCQQRVRRCRIGGERIEELRQPAAEVAARFGF